MLKVECLNNSLWNHLDKTIVVSIVQRLESDRMRQKGETPQGLPLQVCSEMGRKEVAYLSFSLFPRGSFNNRAPSSGQLPKRGSCITDDWQLSQAGACCECPATIFFLIAYCLRGVPTGYSGSLCCWLKGLGQDAFESWGVCRKLVDSHLPNDLAVCSGTCF